ncbi:uncharacterized protein LOC131884888 isoform X1 [Tigriopus californicus]|uniref:uncharacterized protein LOC131884888 isoform X1 n=1 Tax=Tigriopus californicus TaxID=6832 RepID=UPI0027DAB23C|nr:uncharacterized protein LOC131884888 isoform X1 [Tigriopus californicus]
MFKAAVEGLRYRTRPISLQLGSSWNGDHHLKHHSPSNKVREKQISARSDLDSDSSDQASGSLMRSTSTSDNGDHHPRSSSHNAQPPENIDPEDEDGVDRAYIGRHISPSAPSPPDEKERHASNGIHPDIPQCCRDRERTRLALQSERDALRGALRTAESGLSAKDKEMSVKLDALHGKHQNSLAEMKSILLAQRQVGAQWKEEMTILTKRFEVKVKELQSENKELKMELERLREVFKVKEVEADEARELNGIYSAKLTKMERKFKKLKDEDEESYMEMTF